MRKRRALLLIALVLGLSGTAFLFRRPIKRLLRPSAADWKGRFADPEGLAADREGNLYVADEDRGVLWMVTPKGDAAPFTGFATRGDSLIALAPGRVIAIGRHEVVELELRGSETVRHAVFGGRGAGPGQFEDPEGISLDTNGDLYASDEDHRRILVFARDGSFLRLWPVPDDPESVCVWQDRVYVTFSKACWVGCFSKTGELRFRFGSKGSGPGKFNVPDYVCVSPDRRLYVTDQKNSRIQVFDLDGAFQFEFGRGGSAPGEFSDPEDLAFDPAGNLVVADGGNHRIQVLTPRGAPLRVID